MQPSKKVNKMANTYIFGWRRTTWALIAYVMLGLVVSLSLYRVHVVQEQFAQQVARENQSAIDSGYKTCLSANRIRNQLRQLIITATSTQGPDYSKFSTFQKLDKSMQDFLIEVTTLSNSDERNNDPNGFRQRALRDIADRDCEAEFPEHTPGISLS